MSTVNDKPVTITLGELEASKQSSVWVLNNSSPKGNLNMTMSDGMGQTLVVRIPVTWIPVDVTTQATKNSILASPNFRRLIALKAVTLVSEDYAQRVMNRPDAIEEAQRIYSNASELSVSEAYVPKEAQIAAKENDGSVSGMAMNLAMATDMDEDKVFTTLRNNESAMTPADFKYIAEMSQFPRVKSHAASMLVS